MVKPNYSFEKKQREMAKKKKKEAKRLAKLANNAPESKDPDTTSNDQG